VKGEPRVVRIGKREVGPGRPCFVVAEVGINHNGSVELAKRLIDVAARHGADAVKFQKRTPELCVPREQWGLERDTPWGRLPYIEYRRRLEFGLAEYEEIDRHCRERGLPWYASCWDADSVAFLERFDPPCHKVASACLTDDELLGCIRRTGRPVVLATGMSTLDEIDHAMEALGGAEVVLLHSTSSYPAREEELNLDVIASLRQRYDAPIGYSGHEVGVVPSVIAACLGAVMVERHVTLDRAAWGSDQAASLEPRGLELLVRYIRSVPVVRGDGIKVVYESERSVRDRLRRRPSS
jgi:sialic acid synthase SpsE